MRKLTLLIASGLALGIAVAPAMAQETRSTSNRYIDYIGAGIAISQVTHLSDGSALVVNAGKNLNYPGVSVEGEFTSTISKPSTTVSVGGLSASADVSYWTLGGYGVYTLPVTRAFDVRGRLGALFESINFSGASTTGDRNQLKVSAGVGAAFRVTPRVSITADYTRIDEDINHISAGVQFRF